MAWYDYEFKPNYSLSSGDTGQGLQYTPSYTDTTSGYDFKPDYSLSSGGSGMGLNYTAQPDYSWLNGSSKPDYSLTNSQQVNPAQQPPQLDYSFASPQYGFSSYSPQPTQVGLATGLPTTGVTQGTAPVAQQKSIAPVGQAGLSGSMGGITGGIGTDDWTRQVNALSDARAMRQGTQQSPEGVGLIEQKFNDLEAWSRAHPRVASGLTNLAGIAASYLGQRQATNAMNAQTAMQQQALASQQEQIARNNANADYWNAQARQSANEARSLYNPQELAVRGMSQQVAATQRNADAAYKQALKQGMSPADAAAVARRVRVAGSANATTGYMSGLDVGRQAQTSALSSAKGLSSNYSGLNGYNPSSALADYYTRQGAANSKQLQDLLEFYLGHPTTQVGMQQNQTNESKTS